MARLFDGTAGKGSVAVNLSSYSLITMAFWLWWDAFANNDKLAFEYTATTNSTAGSFIIDPNSNSASTVVGKWGFAIADGSGAGGFWGDGFTRPSAAAWHHYVLVMDRATPANTAYVDGVLQTLTAGTHGVKTYGAFANSTLNLMSRNGGSLFGAGRMSDLAIWGGVALTNAEAATLAAGVSATRIRAASLIDSWKMPGVTSPEPDDAATGRTGITITGATQTNGPAWTTSGTGIVVPSTPPLVVPGHPAMSRSRAFFPMLPPAAQSYTGESIVAAACTITTTGTLTALSTSTVDLADTVTTAGTPEKFGATVVAISDTITTAGTLGAFSASTAPFAATITTAGTPEKLAASTVQVAFAADDTGTLGAFGASTAGLTDAIDSAGIRDTFGVATVLLAVTITTAGESVEEDSATLTVTFGAATAGTVTAFAATSLTTSVAIDDAGTRETHGAADLPAIVGITTAGSVGAYGTSTSTTAISVTDTGTVTAFSSSTAPFTIHISTAASVEAFSGATLHIVDTVTTAGTRTLLSAATLPVAVTITTAGALLRTGSLTLLETLMITTAGRITFAGGPPGTLATTTAGRIDQPRTGHQGRPSDGAISDARSGRIARPKTGSLA